MDMKSPRHFFRVRVAAFAAMTCLSLIVAAQPASAQGINSEDRSRGHLMLDAMKDDIKRYYYDPNFHGIDVEARFKQAHELIKQAKTLGDVFGIIAQTMMSFDDSHTFFIPPAQTLEADYGWQWRAIGDKCFVVAVKPKSEAEKVGLKVGDQVLTIDGVPAKREDLWKLKYLYNSLRPAPGMRLFIASPGETKARMLDVPAKVTSSKRTLNFTGLGDGNDIHKYIWERERAGRIYRNRTVTMGTDLIIWKMPQFAITEKEVDSMMGKVKGHQALILDLRGNGGGYESTLLHMIGYFFDHDIKVADVRGRKEAKARIAKSRGNDIFKGKVAVLIDNESASASEMFARVIQLEKRGTILGDRSSGMVMRAKGYEHDIGMDIKVFYGSEITESDVIMADGKSLEKVGVTPDEVVLPTGADLAANRDPVLARAAELLGVKLEAEKAGSFFPIEWVK
jgi:C-terminal processing protease CtpA/Prc